MTNINELEKILSENVKTDTENTEIVCEVEHVQKQPMSDDYRRLYTLLHRIFKECKKYGYHLENRLELRDLKTGKIFK